MSHQEKQEIFDQYAKSQEFENWNHLKNFHLENDIDIDEEIFAACNLVQEEQQKRIAERISNSEFQKGHPVDISSIINPENKIQ
ncbi:hypothetical protein [Chryseobacterium aquifrigidense]|uniref:Uncharacterized protein n=1 Tax=Chryseobacterium aquifrigidense TaxID=558021 RepID=A0A543E9P7_9FLAO|nr:hypothetical protein [Chryseobacterium aquifrigidense]TQM18307.1 hypothetical protein FB551_4088 [Chryseobacterium aquifrigidense]